MEKKAVVLGMGMLAWKLVSTKLCWCEGELWEWYLVDKLVYNVPKPLVRQFQVNWLIGICIMREFSWGLGEEGEMKGWREGTTEGGTEGARRGVCTGQVVGTYWESSWRVHSSCNRSQTCGRLWAEGGGMETVREREGGRRDEREDERMVREDRNSKTYLVFGINVSELKFLVQNQESRIWMYNDTAL